MGVSEGMFTRRDNTRALRELVRLENGGNYMIFRHLCNP